MKRLFAFLALLLAIGFSSCQCSDKPDIGPVEDENQASVIPAPRSADSAHRPHA
jgi:hypothetical protein